MYCEPRRGGGEDYTNTLKHVSMLSHIDRIYGACFESVKHERSIPA
jgi:hypothetical protein